MRGGSTAAVLIDTAPRTLIDNNLRKDQMRAVPARHREVERSASSGVRHMPSATTHLAVRMTSALRICNPPALSTPADVDVSTASTQPAHVVAAECYGAGVQHAHK